MWSGSSIPYRSTISSASAQVVGSGSVGPDATLAGSLPGTSEISKVNTLAGWQAAARRPPLIDERCRRRQFMSLMVTPISISWRMMSWASSKVTPGAGSASRDEPPPDIMQTTVSSSVRLSASARMRLAAARPASSGTGWAASTTSIPSQGTAWP